MINGKVVVHLRGPVMTASGYGRHTRQIVDYLLEDQRFELFLEGCNWGMCPYEHNLPNQAKYYECMAKYEQLKAQNIGIDITIQVTIPNEFKRCAQVNIGVTAGIEVDRSAREWIVKCNEMDLIVVPSEHSKNVLCGTTYQVENKKTGEKTEEKVNKPVVIIPEWFEKPKSIKPLELDFSTKFNFLYVGLWGNKGGFGEDRKNIANLVKYFLNTFKDEKDVGLVLKTNIINASNEDKEYTVKRINEIKQNFKNVKCKIHLIHEHLTDDEMWGLYTHPSIKAYLGIQHGEGYGLPMIEAASVGLPVITTNWSGQLDFLKEKHGFIPLDYELKDIPDCQHWENVMEKGSKWAEVPEEVFKKATKKFHNSSFPIIKAAKENVNWLEENFSKEVVSKKWQEFFDQFFQKPTEQQQISEHLNQKQQAAQSLSSILIPSDKKKVLYIMPRSAGDVLISTAIVEGLKKRHEDCDFYFATTEPYKELLGSLGVNVVDYQDQMMSSELTSEVFDYVYNPGVNVQYNFSNWLLGNGEYSVRLLEELAKNCNLFPNDVGDYNIPIKECSLPEDKQFIVFGPGGIKSAKTYKDWDDVLQNIKLMAPEIDIIQLGTKDEKLYTGCLDYRGLSYAESAYVMSKAVALVGIDSFPAHLAAAMGTPHIILYGSTSANTVTPVLLSKRPLQVLIETTDRNGCKNPCYKDTCANPKEGRNCLSNIDASAVSQFIFDALKKLNEQVEK